MDLTAAQTELKARGFDYLSTTRLNYMLNLGKNALESLQPWPWLEATTTGTAPLTISDLRHVLYVVDTTNQVQLPGMDVRAVVDLDPTLPSGSPSWWWLDGSTTLRLAPTSTSASLSVRYVKWSPELSAGADTPLIPTREHPVWIDFAQVEAYKDSDNYQAAIALDGDLTTRQIPRMVNAYLGRNMQGPDLVGFDPSAHADA
jgi:hypothetical protein